MSTSLKLPCENNDNVIMIWERYTLQEADTNTDFFESGGDSLAAINLIIEIEKIYNVKISLEDFMRNPTIHFLYKVTSNKDNEIYG